MKYYKQKENAEWIKTPKGTIWILTPQEVLDRFYSNPLEIPRGAIFIVPKDEKLRRTPLGVRLDKHKNLFDEIPLF